MKSESLYKLIANNLGTVQEKEVVQKLYQNKIKRVKQKN